MIKGHLAIWAFVLIAVSASSGETDRKPLDEEFLRNYMAGEYDLIGRKADSSATYNGHVTLRDERGVLQVTRTVEGKTDKCAARFDTVAGNVLAPFPPGLMRRTTNCDSAEVDQLEFPFLHHAHFVRSVERFQNDRYLVPVHLLNIENLLVKSKAPFRIPLRSLMDWEKRFEARRFGAGKIKIAGQSRVIVRIRLPAVGGVIFLAVKMKMHS